VVPDDPNPFEQIFTHFADRLGDAPGAARLARLAQTAKRIPEPLLEHLAELIVRLDDVQLIGNGIFLNLIEVSHCDARYTDATAFASALAERLQRYLDKPLAADSAREVFRERTAWWRMALSRAGDLSRWPALVVMEVSSGE
jgi:hypothetical protein